MSVVGAYGISTSVLPMERRIVTCIGFGVDHYHGVNSCLFFENTSEIITKFDNGFLGVCSVVREWNCFKQFKKSCQYTFNIMKKAPSIVSSCIIAAIEGQYGNYHPPEIKSRTSGSTLYINPMMSMYWFYSLNSIANQLLYKKFIETSKSMEDLNRGLRTYRNNLKTMRKPSPFPH